MDINLILSELDEYFDKLEGVNYHIYMEFEHGRSLQENRKTRRKIMQFAETRDLDRATKGDIVRITNRPDEEDYMPLRFSKIADFDNLTKKWIYL